MSDKMSNLSEKEYKLLKGINELFQIDITDRIEDALKIEICDYILKGNLIVKYKRIPKSFSYEKDLKFNIDSFDWDKNYPKVPSAFQLHLQGFNTIKYLIQGYVLSLNQNYFDLASKFIKSWLEYEPNSKNKFTWFDHSASDRALVMIYYLLVSKKNNITLPSDLISKIHISIIKHADFFYEDNNYKLNNHGTMSDKALYAISVYLNDHLYDKYREKSIIRLKNALKRNFSQNMINLESSIPYHLFNMELFVSIEKLLLNPFEDSCGISQSSIKKSVDFLIDCVKPDMYFPMIGDSQKLSIKSIINYCFFSYVESYMPLKWLLTSQKSGTTPKNLFKVYKKEGFAFFRNSWDQTKKDEISYVSFISGSGSPEINSHKHADDLSFTLFAKNKDIFVDSGTYTYEKGDMRKFFISALAHNTVIVDDQNYPLKCWGGSEDNLLEKPKDGQDYQIWGDKNDTGIIDYGEKEDYYYVVGKNDMYDGVNITRTLYYLRSGDIIIIDDIQSYDIHKYSQYYHLSPKINARKIDFNVENNNTNIKIYDDDDDISITLFQLGQCNVEIINGNKKKAGPGIISEKFGDLEETKTIKFYKSGKNTRFITLINVKEAIEKNNKKIYIKSTLSNIHKDELIIKEDLKEINIPLIKYSRKIYKNQRNVILEKEDTNLFKFTVTDAHANETFAWYILKNGETIDKIWYSSNPILKYLFMEKGKYQIKYFVKKGNDKKMYTFPKIVVITEKDLINSKIRVSSLESQ